MKKYISILIIMMSNLLALAQTNLNKATFNVSKQSKVIAVSPIKMNILYIGVDNPIEIAISDVPAKYITATIENGAIQKLDDGEFSVKVSRGISITKINVYENFNGCTTKIGEKIFRVKQIPDPIACIGGINSGRLNKNIIAASQMLVAKFENFDFDLPFKITSYTFLIMSHGDIIPVAVSGNILPADIINKINKASPGTKIYFEDIKAVGPDGINRTLSPICVKLQ